jgi:diguanylate cyclase (GGDEF)-like protein
MSAATTARRADPETALAVLVVESDAVAGDALARAVRQLGYRCAAVCDGALALDMLAASRFDVVLSDWKMPRLDGLGLCRAMRAREHEYTYFAFLAAETEKDAALRALREGADDLLAKPVDLGALEVRLIAAKRVIDARRELNARNRELRRDSQRNFQLAHFDTLTGTRNRLALSEDMRAARESLNRYGTQCAVAMCDIDRFKLYNDAFGHVRGDAVLRDVADIMRRALRSGDRLYRFGGEEFVVLLREQGTSGALPAMQRIRCAVEAAAIRHAPNAGCPFVTISAGVAQLSSRDDDAAVIRRADAALYRAKALGRNRVEI